GAVEQVEADVVLPRRVVRALGALAAAAEAVGIEHAREPADVIGDLCVAEPARGGDGALAVRVGRGQRLEHAREIHARREGCAAPAAAASRAAGCGSAVYLDKVARRAPARRVAVDFGPATIELAQRRLAAAGVSLLPALSTTDFVAYSVEVPFDNTLAVGVF